MKKSVVLFTLAAIIFAACSGQKKSEVSSLRFKTITVDKEMKHPNAERDFDVFAYKINFTYPDDFENKQVLELIKQNFIENTFGGNQSKLGATML